MCKFFRKIDIIYISIVLILSTACSHKNNISEPKINLDYLQPLHIKDISNVVDRTSQSKIQQLKSVNIIYFPLDRYYILPDFFNTLDIHASFLQSNPLYQIIIEGHTDERGTPEYNIGLGERRAYSVKKYLQSKGVLPNQMHTVSYGKEKPVCFGHTEDDYSKNRRVLLLYK